MSGKPPRNHQGNGLRRTVAGIYKSNPCLLLLRSMRVIIRKLGRIHQLRCVLPTPLQPPQRISQSRFSA
jgi:hypothetical protein